MHNQNKSITILVDQELSTWLRQQAAIKTCKISDLVRKSIYKFKQAEQLSEDLLFSSELHVKGAKAALMAYRLLEMLTPELIQHGNQLVEEASNRAKEDLKRWKINSNK